MSNISWRKVTLSVADAFSAFRDNYLIPATTVSSISYRYKRITKQLNKDFWSTDSETAHSLYVGSYGRDTAAKGLSDLDVAFELPAAVYHQYNGHAFNGQSQLLQAVKRSIQNTYRTSDSFGDGQVVVISFDDGITFEILPVFVNTSGTYTYPNANSGGSWKTCDPRAEIKAINDRNAVTNFNLKYLCRMMRIWKSACSVPMSGMLIDTLAYQFIEGWPYRDKSFLYHDFMTRDFFEFLYNQNADQSWWRAPGSASYVSKTGDFKFKARSAYLRSLEAIDHHGNQHNWAARQKWRQIFGNLFPA